MSSNLNIIVSPLEQNDREQFILGNKELLNSVPQRNLEWDHFEEDGEIISRKTIEDSIDSKNAKTYRIILDNKKIGVVVLKIDEKNKKGELELLFINLEIHSKGAGYSTWLMIEKMYPEIEIWETLTPYFEKRNIHFYINKFGFQIVDYYHKYHPLPKRPHDQDKKDGEEEFEMFRFQKIIKKWNKYIFILNIE